MVIDFGDKNVEHAISLLQKLLERSPADIRNRMRLLTLLNGQRDREAFLEQVGELSVHCDPVDEQVWAQVCTMGRALDPDNPLFAEGPGLEGETAAAIGEVEGAYDDQVVERRRGEDRRKGDRRENISTWTGKEQRYWRNRRQNYRREDDARELQKKTDQ